MMTVKAKQFKVGDKVRILNVRGITGANEYFKDGDTTHVLKIASDDTVYLYCNDGDYEDGLFILDSEHRYVELLESKPSNSERISALESQVAELQAELQSLKKRKKPKHLLTHYPTPNEQRKAVIERAKAFLENTKEKPSYEDTLRYTVKSDSPFVRYVCDVNFIVNSDKRTVVALLKWRSNGKVVAKAIAKCAPDDVFNADIGKAIALGRALGLDVSEFENAPKPTEVVVGMRVGNMYDEITYKVTSIADGKLYVDGSEQYWRVDTLSQSVTFITEDTEAKY